MYSTGYSGDLIPDGLETACACFSRVFGISIFCTQQFSCFVEVCVTFCWLHEFEQEVFNSFVRAICKWLLNFLICVCISLTLFCLSDIAVRFSLNAWAQYNEQYWIGICQAGKYQPTDLWDDPCFCEVPHYYEFFSYICSYVHKLTLVKIVLLFLLAVFIFSSRSFFSLL